MTVKRCLIHPLFPVKMVFKSKRTERSSINPNYNSNINLVRNRVPNYNSNINLVRNRVPNCITNTTNTHVAATIIFFIRYTNNYRSSRYVVFHKIIMYQERKNDHYKRCDLVILIDYPTMWNVFFVVVALMQRYIYDIYIRPLHPPNVAHWQAMHLTSGHAKY